MHDLNTIFVLLLGVRLPKSHQVSLITGLEYGLEYGLEWWNGLWNGL